MHCYQVRQEAQRTMQVTRTVYRCPCMPLVRTFVPAAAQRGRTTCECQTFIRLSRTHQNNRTNVLACSKTLIQICAGRGGSSQSKSENMPQKQPSTPQVWFTPTSEILVFWCTSYSGALFWSFFGKAILLFFSSVLGFPCFD